MEAFMQYKTIVLELLQQLPEMHDQLRRKRTLLPTLNRFASQLKANHEAWKKCLSQAKPEAGESQIASEALEIALKEMVDCLACGFPPEGTEPLSLDAAMAFIHGRKLPE
jgi:hypothetical protein